MMSEAKTSLRDAIRIWAAETRAELPEQAPGDDELAAYLAQELDEPQREEIRRRLVLDPSTTARLLEQISAGSESDREDIVDALLAFDTIEIPKPAPEVVAGSGESSLPSFGWSRVAAVFVAIALGLWGLNALNRPTGPVAAVLSPAPRMLELASGRTSEPVELRPETSTTADTSVLVSLALVDAKTYERYQVELIGPDGNPLGQLEVLRQPEGHILFALDPTGLPGGRYSLILRAETEDSSEPLLRYSLDLRAPESSSEPSD